MEVSLISSVALFFGTLLTVQWLLSWIGTNWKRSHSPYPPSLPALSVIGSLLFMPGDFKVLPDFFMKTAAKLGSIFAYYSGSRYTVVVNGKDAYVEAFVRNSATFAGKEAFYQEKHHSNRNLKGLFGKPFNQDYKVNHVLILSILKEFGLGKDNSMELRILNEIEHFIEEVKKMKGAAFDPDSVLRENVVNVMLTVLFGQRYDSSDDRLERFARYTQLFMANLSPDLDIVPMARFLPSYREKIKIAGEANKLWLDLIKQEMAETMKRSGKNSFVEMFVDKAGPEYDQEDLLYIVRDLIMGGSDSMVVTIRWALVVLANNPRIQESLQNEIDSVVPGDRLPSMDDKINLPEVDAAFQELLRWKTLAPLSDHHVTMSDTVVSGQFIPAGTLVIPNIWSVNMDPDVFPEPEKFKLERFLNDDGKAYGSDRCFSFSVGRRSCLGQVLARQEVFLLFAAVLQHFNVFPPGGQKSLEVKEVYRTLLFPLPFEVCLVPRK